MGKMKDIKQFLVIIRGAPASGKTTIAKSLRGLDKKIVWLKVDNFKDFFVEVVLLEGQKYVDKCALVALGYLLDEGFSVVMEKIFFDPSIIPLAVDVVKRRGIKVAVFQIKCPLEILQKRDRNRPGIKEGCRKPLGDEVIKRIYDQLEKSFYPGGFVLDTENLSPEECVGEIKRKLAHL